MNAIQYRVTYTSIEFGDNIPGELLAYGLPQGFKEIDKNPELQVGSVEEAAETAVLLPKYPKMFPGDIQETAWQLQGYETVKLSYISQDKKSRVIILQKKQRMSLNLHQQRFRQVGGNTAEIQSPVQDSPGVLKEECIQGWRISARFAGRNPDLICCDSDAPMNELISFIESITTGPVEIPPETKKPGEASD